MKRLIGWLGRALSFVLTFGPAFIRKGLAYFLAFLWFDLFRIRRSVVLDNIAIAFPNMSLSDRTRLGRRSIQHWALNLVEYCYLPWLSRENFHKYFEFHNTEIMDQALAKNRGVLLLTLHLGHGDLACAGLSLRGFPMVLVSKTFKAEWLNEMWFGMRERLGTRFIPARDSSFALLKSLKKGNAVTIPLDQFTGPPIGVKTTFFGVETGTAAGMAVMAERSGAPVVSVYTVRGKDGRQSITFGREIPARLRPEETAEEATQRFNDELEGFVRQYPDQWMWIHRRWKKFKY